MKVLILAGGYGTRLSEETDARPKPMIEIGGMPILWHIMKIYSYYGFEEFIVLLGYKGYIVKEYFANYFLHQSDVTIDLHSNKMEIHNNASESWKVTLLDTGLDTLTGGRVLKARKFIGDETFMLTYGDGVADIDIKALLAFHKAHKKAATMTVVQPDGRYGAVELSKGNEIIKFVEKPRGDNVWVNGGFFVCGPEVFDYLTSGDMTSFEQEPLIRLADDGKLMAYRHDGFWKCMDTLRDKTALNQMWEKDAARWKVWK